VACCVEAAGESSPTKQGRPVTVGIGIIPRQETGLVLLTDGLNHGTDLEGGDHVWEGDDKLLALPDRKAALVISGHVNDGSLDQLGLRKGAAAVRASLSKTAHPFSQADMRGLFGKIAALDAEVRGRRPKDDPDRYDELDEPGPGVIVAALQPEGPPMLGRFSPVSERWARPGETLVIGCVQLRPDLVEELQRPAPDTIEECRALAIDWACRFMDRVFGRRDGYRMALETGQLPGVSLPLYVLTVRETNFDLEVIK